MTPNKEDYLKIIYQESTDAGLVSNKVIADRLGVTPASVTEMLAKLAKNGLIDYVPYKGSSLTEKGLDSCLEVVRSHRLWEVFLKEKLQYSWSDAHDEAHMLEHASSVKLIDMLDEYLGYPEYCPHGAVVPRRDNQSKAKPSMRLSEHKVGDLVRIYRLTEERQLLDYLEELQISIGELLEIVAIGEYEGPITCKLGDKTVQISYKAASKIYVIDK